MKRKIFYIFIILIVLQLQLMGCGGNTISGSDDSDTPPFQDEVPIPPKKDPPKTGITDTPPPPPTTAIPPAKLCGNGKLDEGEICDGNFIGAFEGAPLNCSFVTNRPSEGSLSCNEDCTLNTNACIPLCGNGKLDPKEECDAGNPSTSSYCTNNCHLRCGSGETPGIFKGNGKGESNGAGHCYLDINQEDMKVNYAQAQSNCESFGAHLVIFDSVKEYDFIVQNVIKTNPENPRWIGLKRGTSRNPNQSTNYFENFYWNPFKWGNANTIQILPELAWKGRHGRAPEALEGVDNDVLKKLWSEGGPNDCGGTWCIYPEESVEMLGQSDSHLLNDAQSDIQNNYICEREPPVLFP